MTQTTEKRKTTPPAGSQEAIRPFRVTIPEKEIVEPARDVHDPLTTPA